MSKFNNKATEKQKDTMLKLSNAAACLGFYRYESKSYHCDYDAEQNLNGRTHYIDEATRRFFFSRVNGGHHMHGLVYVLLESQAGDYQNKARQYNVVTFDIFGTVIEKAEFNTSKKARDYYHSYDVKCHQVANIIKHTKKALDERFKRMSYEKRNAKNALKGLGQ